MIINVVEMLVRMTCRGVCSCETNTGDGARIIMLALSCLLPENTQSTCFSCLLQTFKGNKAKLYFQRLLNHLAIQFSGGVLSAQTTPDCASMLCKIAHIFNVHHVLEAIPCQEQKDSKNLFIFPLQFLAFCLSAIGLWAAWKLHIKKGIDNFYILRSWLGQSCLLLFAIQLDTGFVTFGIQVE